MVKIQNKIIMNKICFTAKIAARYREEIHLAMDSAFDIDWYFGENQSDVKEYDVSKLKHCIRYKVCGSPEKISWKRGMLKTLFSRKYQTYIMHVETRAVSDWVWMLCKSLFFPKKHVYTWAHGWYGKEKKIEAAMKLWLYRRLTGIFVYGQYAKDLIVKRGIPAEKIFVIHNSLHYTEQLKLRKSLSTSDIYKNHFKNDNPVLVMIGRLNLRKHLDMLVDAVEILKNKGEIYNVVLIGNGEDKAKLEQMVAEKGLRENFWFYGACYDEEINAELLYNSDMCVVPGDVGLTAIHSLMFGVPVVSHNCFKYQGPEFETIKPGITGNFYEYGSVNALASCISNWFKEKAYERNNVRQDCYNVIDTEWNPNFQMKVLSKHLK